MVQKEIESIDAAFYDYQIEEIEQTLQYTGEGFELQMKLLPAINHETADVISRYLAYYLTAEMITERLREVEEKQLSQNGMRMSLEEIKKLGQRTTFSMPFLDCCSFREGTIYGNYSDKYKNAINIEEMAKYSSKLSAILQQQFLLFPYTTYCMLAEGRF